MRNRKYAFQYHMMLFPVIALMFVFSVVPMFGIVIAFEKYYPAKGIAKSEFVGLKYFTDFLLMSNSWRIIKNTVIIAFYKIIANLVAPITFSLLLNEIKNDNLKRVSQTMIYLPHFMSWVVLTIPIMNMFALDGIVNKVVAFFGAEKRMFMVDNELFRPLLIITHTWKEFGFGTIVYLAAITGIDPSLYEAAVIDGATRLQRMRYVTLPGISTTIVLLATRSLGDVLNAGFDQVFNLYSPSVYEVADIIDTYVYRVGLVEMNFSLSTAVGLAKSVIGIFLILSSNKLAEKLANYRIY